MRLKTTFLVFVLAISMLVAAIVIDAREITLPKDLGITQAENEILIPQGEDAIASLPLFSRTYIRIYEGSRLNFNVVDPDNGVVLISNTMVIKEITRNYTLVDISLNDGQFEEMRIIPSFENELNFTYTFMPFMLLTQVITHYNEDEAKRNIVLYFNIPFVKAGKNLDGLPASGFLAVDPSKISSTSTIDKNEGINPIIIVMLVIIVLLITSIAYLKLKKSKKLKHR